MTVRWSMSGFQMHANIYCGVFGHLEFRCLRKQKVQQHWMVRKSDQTAGELKEVQNGKNLVVDAYY